ncbi:MAG TPA: hypothetical protein PK671_08405 [Candidatus Obscuribacter sp.]|nr:hypothetical protein [Candidatus Obscuribacter sp.]
MDKSARRPFPAKLKVFLGFVIAWSILLIFTGGYVGVYKFVSEGKLLKSPAVYMKPKPFDGKQWMSSVYARTEMMLWINANQSFLLGKTRDETFKLLGKADSEYTIDHLPVSPQENQGFHVMAYWSSPLRLVLYFEPQGRMVKIELIDEGGL